MTKAFISYSTRDVDFAQLCQTKLEAAEIEIWMDQTAINAGDPWRESIDEGIQSSDALVLIVSPNSTDSAYVTYEWALAIGLGLKVLPVLLTKADKHPRLATLQHLDFSTPNSRPWDELIGAVKEASKERPADSKPDVDVENESDIGTAKELILGYLADNGFRMVSFERIRENIDSRYSNDFLMELIGKNAHILLPARLRGGKSGLKKRT